MVSYDAALIQQRPEAGRTVGERLVRGLLFLAIFSSAFVLIEPAPYEGLVGLLALVAFAAGLAVDRATIPLALLLLVWNMSGLVALMPIADDQDAVMFIATSFYLAGTAFLFACLFSQGNLRRLSILRTAYMATATVAAAIGAASYFQVMPGSQLFLTDGARVSSSFKDPNVFGPFLVLPLLFVIDAILRRGFGPLRVLAVATMLLALFLTFSRGAWAHFIVSVALMVFLTFVTVVDLRFRARILALAFVAAAAIVAALAALLSMGAIGEFFQERATFLQEYDAGELGRFGRQAEAVLAILEAPLGLGPLQIGRQYGQDPHNVFLNAFLSYGWIGGIAYFMLVLTTLWMGLRAVFVRTPWQYFLIPVYATFVGVVAEGIVIDTDHWRHYYLLLGLVWGLIAATQRHAAMSQPNDSAAGYRVISVSRAGAYADRSVRAAASGPPAGSK
jgi:O-antigen ligase